MIVIPRFHFSQVFLILCMLPIGFAKAQDAGLESRIDTILSDWNQTANPGAAVAYVDAGETLLQKSFGLANLEHEITWTTNTVSDLGSVSKQFIGFVFALLSEQGQLDLDDDIRDYLPGLPDT